MRLLQQTEHLSAAELRLELTHLFNNSCNIRNIIHAYLATVDIMILHGHIQLLFNNNVTGYLTYRYTTIHLLAG